MVSDLDAIKQILIQKFDCFQNRGVSYEIRLGKVLKHGIFL